MRIPMTSGFQLIPEGKHVFRIYDVKEDEDFGTIEIMLVNAQGMTMRERFGLKDSSGEWNEGALNAFSFFAKTALNDFDIEDVDAQELVNHYISATVVHNSQPNKNDPSKTVTFANLDRDKEPADGFDTKPCDRALTLGTPAKAAPKAQTVAKPVAQAQPTGGLDLDALLG